MNTWIKRESRDGFVLDAYLARPSGTPLGGLVILPEIFGVNSHIRDVTERYAALGYLAIAPAVFDRVERNLDLGYTEDDVRKGQALMKHVAWDTAVDDVEAAGRRVSEAGNVGIVGYCWGGAAAWATAAQTTTFRCAVSYYGNAIATLMDRKPKIPMMLHWGEEDHRISKEKILQIIASAPDAESFIYPTGHGFNCDQRSLYHEESARLANERTREFLQTHLSN